MVDGGHTLTEEVADDARLITAREGVAKRSASAAPVTIQTVAALRN
jgi:hypothetical protein